jgi:DNA-directed RNA polymerase specialized sigma24 family protein
MIPRVLLTDEELLSKLPTTHLVGMDETVVWHDLFVLIDSRYPDEERWIAAQWIAYCWFRKPIAWQRWRVIGSAVNQELAARAKANGTSSQTELRACVAQALFLAGKEPVDFAGPGPRKAFLRRLNNLVVEDLVGPGWREQNRAIVDIGELEGVLAEQSDLAGEVEVALDLERAINRARLGRKEAQVLKATLEGGSVDEIAAKLNMASGSVRTARSRARTKLRAARQ